MNILLVYLLFIMDWRACFCIYQLFFDLIWASTHPISYDLQHNIFTINRDVKYLESKHKKSVFYSKTTHFLGLIWQFVLDPTQMQLEIHVYANLLCATGDPCLLTLCRRIINIRLHPTIFFSIGPLKLENQEK